MACSSISRLVRISCLITIVIAVSTGNGAAASKAHCPCRPVADCSYGVPRNFGDLLASPTCGSPGMIRCCAALRGPTRDPSRISQSTSHARLQRISNDESENPSDDFESEKVPSTTEHSEKYNGDTLLDIRRIVSKRKRLHPSAANAAGNLKPVRLDDYSARKMKRPMKNVAKDNVMPSPVTFLFPESMKTGVHSSVTPSGETDYVQSAVESNDESERYSSSPQQLIDEAAAFESMKINPPRNHRGRRRDNDDWRNTMKLDTTDGDVGGTPPPEFGGDVSRTNAHYVEQSMVSSPKDLPTTPAVNSFEQKTSSETFLALDRISTRSIDKNTWTTGNGEHGGAPPVSDGVAAFAAKTGLPCFSMGNARENNQQELARKCVDCAQNKLREKPGGDYYRELLSVESVTSMPRRSDPLQAVRRDKRSSVSGAPTVLQKNILKTSDAEHPEQNENVKNTEGEGRENKTAERQSQNVKSSLASSSSSSSSSPEAKIKADGKESADADAGNAAVPTTIAPMRKLRFPPRVLPMKIAPRKKEPTNSERFDIKHYFSGQFRHFYEARKQLRSRIEKKAENERNKTRRQPLLTYWKKNQTSEQSVTLKSETENNHASSTNISERNISAGFNGKNSSASSSALPSLQDGLLASNTDTVNVDGINNSTDFRGRNSTLENKILASDIKMTEANGSINFNGKSPSDWNSSTVNLEDEITASDIKLLGADGSTNFNGNKSPALNSLTSALKDKALASNTKTVNDSRASNFVNVDDKNLSALNSLISAMEGKILAAETKTVNVGKAHNSIDSGGNNASTSKSSTTNPQNESFASKKVTMSHSNTVSRENFQNSMRMKRTNAAVPTVSLVFARSWNVSSEEVAQDVDEHRSSKQSLKLNVEKDHTQKPLGTESPIAVADKTGREDP